MEDDKKRRIGLSLICVGSFLMLFGFTTQLINLNSKRINKINKNIVEPTPNPNEKFGNEIIKDIDNNTNLTEQEKGYARIYASHYKLQDSVTKDEFNKKLKPTTSNDNIVENEIKTLIAYMNGQIDLPPVSTEPNYVLDPCFFLSLGSFNDTDFVYNNVFNQYYTNIAECMYGFEYVEVEDNMYGSTKLISSSDYDRIKNYFTDVKELESYDNKWKNVDLNDETDKAYYEKAKSYLDKNYLVAYDIGDGFGFSGRFFELDGVNKISNTKYQIEISIYYSDTIKYYKKTGKLDVEVVDKHLKYGKLVFE